MVPGIGTMLGLPLPDPNRSRYDNYSIDVLRKTCWSNYDEVACVRSTLLCILAAVTGVLCLGRIWKFHLAPRTRSTHLLILFYICAVHTFSGTVEWVWGWTTQGSLTSLYLRSLELIVVTHFYLTLTTRVHHCQTDLAPRLMVMSLSVLFVYFTSFIVVGFVYADSPWFDCYATYWLWITAGHLATIQVLVLTSLLLCRKLNRVSAQASFKSAQKRRLWLMLGAFELSALSNLAYHLVLFLTADEEIGCSGVFHHRQSEYSAVKVSYEVLVFLLPIWVMLFVFRPSLDPDAMGSSTLDSEDPTLVPPTSVINWRNRYRPLTFNNLVQPHSMAIPYRRLANPRVSGRRRLRSVRRNANAPKRGAVGTPTSPALATIPEESHSSTISSSPQASASFSGLSIPQQPIPSVSASVEVVPV